MKILTRAHNKRRVGISPVLSASLLPLTKLKPMWKLSSVLGFLLLANSSLTAQEPLDRQLPVRGFCISAPRPSELDAFIRFVEEELAPRAVNTLILRVDYNYQYVSHPELGDKSGLSKSEVAKIAAACRNHHIRVIPQINLLGHQSWARSPGALLRVYPEFDETPWVKFPEKYVWPNPDGLYCKSYCPLHPQVHDVVFGLVDELCDAFETDAFHAGLDEVFYIGEDKCPRCAGRNKAELFAGEVRLLRDHLQQKGRELWMWGDRLLDGKTTGLGEWEASLNGTDRAIDLIPRDVVICDWHYERPDETALYFAIKGLKVVTCPWNNPGAAVTQLEDILRFRQHSTPEVRGRLLGIAQTVWSGSGAFFDRFYGRRKEQEEKAARSDAKCFVKLYAAITAIKQQEVGAPATPRSPDQATGASEKKAITRALVLAEVGAQHSNFVVAARGWLRDFATTHNFELDYVENTKTINADSLARYQIIIQLNYPPYGWTPEAMSAFREYIEKGKGGWVGFHHATLLGEFDGYPMWPWFSEFMGGIRFKNYIASFVSGNIQVEDPAHPCMRGLPVSFPILREEFYTYDRSPRPNVHVLASVDEHSYSPTTSITMGDHPVIWTNDRLAARNVYIFMGHGPDLFDNTNYTALVRNALLWAAGREVP